MVTVWWWCWSDPLQLSESWQNYYIWEICSANQWDAPKTAKLAAVIGQHNGPNYFPRQCPTTHHKINTSKVEWIGLHSFASSTTFTWPLTNQLPLLQASQQLLQGKCFHEQQEAETLFQDFVEFWSVGFYAIEINKHLSNWQKCVNGSGSYFD